MGMLYGAGTAAVAMAVTVATAEAVDPASKSICVYSF